MKTQDLNMLKTGVLRPVAVRLASFVAIIVDRLPFNRKQTPAYRLLLLCVMATAVTWAVGCGDSEWDSSISGIVLDSISQAPIDSAWVSASESPAGGARYTDSTGSFTLVTLGRPHRIFAGKEGYRTKVQSVPGTNLDVRGVIIELVPDTL